MRAISFRGMDINGKWHYGLLAESAGFPKQPDAGVYISNFAGFPWAFQVRIETVGQYTGLSDKNGKKIYEGDLLQINPYGEEEYTAEVKTVEGSPFCIETPWDSESDYFMLAAYGRHFGNVEVIGNIYEHQQLLETPQAIGTTE